MGRGFAVLDTETTGFTNSRDRIIEIAVALTDDQGEVTETFDTLVNPMRNPGPTNVHRITARDLIYAPRFKQIIPNLIELFDGRVLVAHNAPFDLRFLRHEFARNHYEMPEAVVLDTMDLAKQFGRVSSSFTLSAVTRAYGVPLENAHRAAADVRATAQLLAAYRRYYSGEPLFDQALDAAAAIEWPRVPRDGVPAYPRESAA